MVRVACGRVLGHVYRGHGVALAAADLPGGNGDLLPQRRALGCGGNEMSKSIKKKPHGITAGQNKKSYSTDIITDNCGFIKRELVVDNFAGGGGASTGIEQAIGRSVDIAINHDPDAIAMHNANHPGTKHDSEGRPYPKSKQVARCGNAVTPPVPCALVRANLPEMCGKEIVA